MGPHCEPGTGGGRRGGVGGGVEEGVEEVGWEEEVGIGEKGGGGK